MGSLNLILPQFLDLKIGNMTTFPRDLKIPLKKGINVIFGGNHSGKTTIINSLKYGAFGLSWGYEVENIEKRYFASRIKEIGRKSLDIDLVYRLKPSTVNTHRTVFSSGTAEIKAKVSKGSGKSISASVAEINREKEYRDSLSRYMGLLSEGQLRFIPRLIFADEDRKLILWKRNLEDLILGLLTSSENARKLQWVESQIAKTKNELDKLNQDRDQTSERNLDNERIKRFLMGSLKKIEDIGVNKYANEYKKIEYELQECRKKLVQINDGLQGKLAKKSDLFFDLDHNRTTMHGLKANAEKLEERFLKATLNPDNPDKVQFVRNLYYEKKCPFCLSDLSKEINHRKEKKLCYLCGIGALATYEGDTEEINKKVLDLDDKRKELVKIGNGIQTGLDAIDEEIERLSKSREEEHLKETTLNTKIAKLKGIEEDLHKKEVWSGELEEIQIQINNNGKLLMKIDENIKTVAVEIDKINQLYDETKIAMRTEIDSALGRIRATFSQFIDIATNGEILGKLSPNFIPTLNGRTVYYPESASQFERTIMDYAFRIALMSTIAEMTKTYPSLVIETPDEVTDESYIPYLAKAIQNFSSNLSIVITTVSTEMMRCLLKNYKLGERKKRLVNLISKGTTTQRRFYHRQLDEYLSERV